MLENAVRICRANFGNMFLYEGDAYRVAAMHNPRLPLSNLDDASRYPSWSIEPSSARRSD